jgi:hypothetical protein
VRGRVLIDGAARTDAFRLISGYVPQEEPFTPVLTVREQLEFTASLVRQRGVCARVTDACVACAVLLGVRRPARAMRTYRPSIARCRTCGAPSCWTAMRV